MDSISTGESLRIVDNTGIRRDFSSERGKVMNWNERVEMNEYRQGKAQCGNYGNLLSHLIDKNFVKATFLLEK